MNLTRTPLIDRAMDRFIPEPNSGGWLWDGYVNQYGYGRISEGGRGGRLLSAHRVIYEHFRGPIPDGLQIDHLCRVPCCVNPDHLEPVTPQENVRRGRAGIVASERGRARTHCKHGHKFTNENTYFTPDGRRQCRKCNCRRSKLWSDKRAWGSDH